MHIAKHKLTRERHVVSEWLGTRAGNIKFKCMRQVGRSVKRQMVLCSKIGAGMLLLKSYLNMPRAVLNLFMMGLFLISVLWFRTSWGEILYSQPFADFQCICFDLVRCSQYLISQFTVLICSTLDNNVRTFTIYFISFASASPSIGDFQLGSIQHSWKNWGRLSSEVCRRTVDLTKAICKGGWLFMHNLKTELYWARG